MHRILLLLTALQLVTAQSGMQSECDSKLCTIDFTFGPYGITVGGMIALDSPTGAYSGRRTVEHKLLDERGVPRPAPYFQPVMVYRDSLGRLRTEQAMFYTRPGTKPPIDAVLVEIQDPQAGYLYVLDTFHKVAHRLPVRSPRVASPSTAPAGPPGPGSPELIGTREMFGVVLTGRRFKDLEIWTDPKTNVEVLRKITSAQGEITWAVENYSNAEPDPSLFQVPPDYQIVDDRGTVTLELPRGGN